MQTAIIIVILAGVAAGFAVGFQGPFTSLMSTRIGVMESIFIVHLGGAIAAGIPLLFWGGGQLDEWRSVPWYALGAGVLGLAVLGGISYTIPRLGVAPTVVLIVLGQLIVSVVLDQFGLFGAEVRPINLTRIAGLLALLLGVWLVVRQ